jgi:hypothetical protein
MDLNCTALTTSSAAWLALCKVSYVERRAAHVMASDGSMAAAPAPLGIDSDVWVAVFSDPAQPRMSHVARGVITADPGFDKFVVRASLPMGDGTVEVDRTVARQHVLPASTAETSARRALALSARPPVEDCVAQEQLLSGVFVRCPAHSFWGPAPPTAHLRCLW